MIDNRNFSQKIALRGGPRDFTAGKRHIFLVFELHVRKRKSYPVGHVRPKTTDARNSDV